MTLVADQLNGCNRDQSLVPLPTVAGAVETPVFALPPSPPPPPHDANSIATASDSALYRSFFIAPAPLLMPGHRNNGVLPGNYSDA
jgi:hypothetical protein